MPELPQVRPRQVERVLEEHGWVLARTAGSHRIFKHSTQSGTVVLPFHAGDVAKGTLRVILRAAEMTPETFIASL